ncbi:type I-B CRISPR-associated protein Cas8b1/Cst1 [Sporohalobacter salinus]|uniref:type I-B CRISPR-associated protein Cas8b1/Cst1 n=1 Tax=Sporohalobacter salinus TaxID=1494606 RepID=UPI00196051C4|nr:type I-B CRISPR-associated protein Cas8b1/Cst1 [Sporohalobacter salinus]MBM7623758.1 CRISPR-associated protein Cst1 [Sporohalobacter salinus]
MGIVGFIRIIERADKKKEIVMKDNYLEFDSSLLEKFDKYYFDYFLDEYNISKRECDKVKRYVKIAENEDRFKAATKWVQDTIKNNRNKIKGKLENKSYEEEFDRIFDARREIKKPKQLDELKELVEDFKAVMNKKEVFERLTLNKVRSVLSSGYFGQVSFLQRNRARDSVEEQREVMKKDYVQRVLDDVRLDETLQTADNVEELQAFIEEEMDKLQQKVKDGVLSKNKLSKYPYRRLLKKLNKKFIKKGKTLEEIKSYLSDEVLSCSIWEQYRSNSQFTRKNDVSCDFTEGVFIPLAVSNKKSRNFMWNGNTAFPICNLVKLILLCTPAGATEMENDYDGFVNLDTSIEDLYRHNQNLRRNKREEENPFESLIYDIVSEAKQKSKWLLQNILFIEINAEYDSKSCKLNYFNIPKSVATYFKNYAEQDLSKIGDKRFKRNVVNLILSDKTIKNEIYNFEKGAKDTVVVNNLNSLIDAKLRDEVNKETSFAHDPLVATVAKYKLNQIKKECEEVKEKGKTIWWIFNEGQKLGKSIAKNKIQGLAYRLLNATNAKNKKQFMDSLLRVYMGVGKEVPTVLLNVMHEEDMEFETVAHSFVSGFISKDDEQEDKNIVKEEN